MPTFKGEKKNTVKTTPSIDIDGKAEKYFKGIRKSRKKRDTNAADEVVCSYCELSEPHLKLISKTLKVCGQCKMVYYCSPECQHKAWKLHKVVCERYVKARLAAAKENMKA